MKYRFFGFFNNINAYCFTIFFNNKIRILKKNAKFHCKKCIPFFKNHNLSETIWSASYWELLWKFIADFFWEI